MPAKVDECVVIRGGGDLGSGAALRLWRCGFRVVILEVERPIAVRRSVAFSEAIYEGAWQVEDAVAQRVKSAAEAGALMRDGQIPVMVDPRGETLPTLAPRVVVDAIMAKRNTGTSRSMAPVVVALGPGFVAGHDVDAVIETNRGPNLGRVLWEGAAEANTGKPGPVAGQTNDRVLRAPADGVIATRAGVGAIVERDAPLAAVSGHVVTAPFTGLVRGMIRDGIEVTLGMKIGDIDPRLDPALCALVSDKALAIAGGVVEAIMSRQTRREC